VPTYNARWERRFHPRPRFPGVISQGCTAAQIAAPAFAGWCERLHTPVLQHRKLWEWCYILQALEEHGMLRLGARGLGFGVGTEPLVAVLATRGCEVVATDLASDSEHATAWVTSGQHAGKLDDLNREGLCPPDVFARRVSFRPVDMNAVPDDLTGFDFTWSSCALEHLGNLDAGMRFFERQLECLRPGGVAVHTTEYNVGSNRQTVVAGHTVYYRRRDLADLVDSAKAAGDEIDITFRLGDSPADRHVDEPPWSSPHLKIRVDGFVVTSFGLCVRRAREAA
jgi:SAM-dependent methyltransferase